MSKMADLDIILTNHKLSEPQKNAVLEISQGLSELTAKPNTVQSLIKKGLVKAVSREEFSFDFVLTDEFRDELGLGATPINEADRSGGENGDKPIPAGGNNGEDDEALFADGVERFQSHWAEWEKELAGFGEALKWKNTQVWDGLTAEEIREDMDTALPIGRTARRERGRLVRKLTKSLQLIGT